MDIFYLWLLFIIQAVPLIAAQLDVFALPQAPRYAPKPTVPPEYRKYFELEDHARGLVESVIGPRPGGFFPPKSYEIGRPVHDHPDSSNTVLNEVERSIEQFLSAPSSYPQQLPPGFSQGFSVASGGSPLATISNVRKHAVSSSFCLLCFLNTYFFYC